MILMNRTMDFTGSWVWNSREIVYKNVWKPEQVVVCLEADSKIMNEGLTGKELSEKPKSIERLAEFLLTFIKSREKANVTGTT